MKSSFLLKSPISGYCIIAGTTAAPTTTTTAAPTTTTTTAAPKTDACIVVAVDVSGKVQYNLCSLYCRKNLLD